MEDVTAHPKLRGGAESLAAHFDRQHDYAANACLPIRKAGAHQYQPHDPAVAGGPAPPCRAGEVKSEGSTGIMGRTPDYMNMKFAASLRRRACGPARTDATRAAPEYRELPAPPGRGRHFPHPYDHPAEIDKRTDAKVLGNKVTMRKVGETSDGIIVGEPGRWLPWRRSPMSRRVYPGQPIPA